MSDICPRQQVAGPKESPQVEKLSKAGGKLGTITQSFRTVSLILNPRIGHVSPQFCLKHDEGFETVTDATSNCDSLEATWKQLSSLENAKYKQTEGGMIRASREQMRESHAGSEQALPPDSSELPTHDHINQQELRIDHGDNWFDHQEEDQTTRSNSGDVTGEEPRQTRSGFFMMKGKSKEEKGSLNGKF